MIRTLHLQPGDRRRRSAPRRSWSARPPFANAREPLAQAFKPAGCRRRRGFARRSSTTSSPRAAAVRPATTRHRARAAPTATGRVRPTALADVRRRLRRPTRGVEAVFLPVTSTPTRRRTRCRSSTTPATTTIESDTAGEETYSFSGLSGSLDHVLGNAAAVDMVDRRRHLGDQRQRVGRLPVQPLQLQRDAASSTARPVRGLRPQPGDRRASTPDVDRHARSRSWHQRLPRPDRQRPGVAAAGAAVLAGAVKQLRAENPNTVFAAAGDLIGASTFESFIAERQADDRRAQRGRSRGLGCGQPRVRPGLRRPGQPRDGAVRRRPPTPTAAPTGSTSRPTSTKRRRRADAVRRPGPRTSVTSRSASSVRSPSTCPSWSRRRASRTRGHRHRRRGQRRGRRR